MNEKITLPSLVNLLAIESGETKKQSEDFIKAFFSEVASQLIDGETIKIKNFGVFKTISVGARKSVDVSTGVDNEIPAHRKVVFVPSRDVAAEINSPFEMFETVELDDDFVFSSANENLLDKNESIIKEDTKSDEETEANNVPEISETTSSKSSEIETVSDSDDANIDKAMVSKSDTEETITVQEMHTDTSDVESLETELSEESNSNEAVSYEESVAEISSPDNIEEDSDDCNDFKKEDNISAEEILRIEENRGDKRFTGGFLTGFAAAAIIGLILFSCYRFINWENLFGSKHEVVAETINATEDISVNGEHNADIQTETDGESDSESKNNELSNSADVSSESIDHNLDSEKQKIEDSDEDVAPTAPSDKKKFDTITHTRYLTTMAKEHYGNYHLWPYIYMENQSFLGHPDRIRPGTKVVVPDLKKYGVDPNNPNDILKAKRLGVEIYSRYK